MLFNYVYFPSAAWATYSFYYINPIPIHFYFNQITITPSSSNSFTPLWAHAVRSQFQKKNSLTLCYSIPPSYFLSFSRSLDYSLAIPCHTSFRIAEYHSSFSRAFWLTPLSTLFHRRNGYNAPAMVVETQTLLNNGGREAEVCKYPNGSNHTIYFVRKRNTSICTRSINIQFKLRLILERMTSKLFELKKT